MQEEKPKRNYKKEYEIRKKNGNIDKLKRISIGLTPQLFEDFTAQCEINNTNKSEIVKKFIEEYTYGNNQN